MLLQTILNKETDKILGCIHCGLCLPACPTYQQVGNENDSPRGRIYLMRAVAEGKMDLRAPAFARHIDLCLGCRACETACPAGVKYGSLLEATRETLLEHAPPSRSSIKGLQKLMLNAGLKHIFPYPKRLNITLGISRIFRDNTITKKLFNSGIIRSISRKADFALSLLMSTAPVHKVKHVAVNISNSPNPTTALHHEAESSLSKTSQQAVFTGCVMEGLFKHVNDATKRVLAVNDCNLVDVGTQVCCGALHAHSGDMNNARSLAKQNIDAFEAASSPTIIINSAGCGAILKEYGELLKDDPAYAERAEQFSHNVKDITEFLAGRDIKQGAPVYKKVTYDAPCHLYHAQRITDAPQKVLKSIPELDYVPLEGMQDCCGGAGIYNLSESEMSEMILSDKINKVKDKNADVLVTANPGCHMQLAAGVRMFHADCKVQHVVELLDESYENAGFYS